MQNGGCKMRDIQTTSRRVCFGPAAPHGDLGAVIWQQRQEPQTHCSPSRRELCFPQRFRNSGNSTVDKRHRRSGGCASRLIILQVFDPFALCQYCLTPCCQTAAPLGNLLRQNCTAWGNYLVNTSQRTPSSISFSVLPYEYQNCEGSERKEKGPRLS